MHILTFIDDFLIDQIFQPIVNGLYAHLNLNQFHVAKLCIVISLATSISLSYSAFIGPGLFWISVDLAEKRYGNTKSRNPERNQLIFLGIRICFLLISAILTIATLLLVVQYTDIAVYWTISCLWLALNFAACDWPPPPMRKRKLTPVLGST